MNLPGERRLWQTAAALALALLAAVAWKAWPLLFPQPVMTALPAPECDLQRQACTLHFADGGSVGLDIHPKPVPVLQMLDLQVTVNGINAQRVEIDFRGVDMNMGYNRPQLEAQGPGRFHGASVLPVCTRARMKWEAKVLLHTPAGVYSAPFRFSVEK